MTIRNFISDVNLIRKTGDYVGAAHYLGSAILRSKSPVKVGISTERVYVRPRTPDMAVARSCLLGEFDVAIEATRPLKNNFIIDAGGYIGTAAIALARAFPQAKIITIEPSLDNFSLLSKNVAPFNNIVPVNKALGPSEATMTLRDRGTGGWGFTLVERPADRADAAPLHTIQVTTIPAIMDIFGATGIDLLKLDIEGGEHALLADRPAWIDSTRVIFAELHERIIPGCEEVFYHAMKGRSNRASGEKVLSI
jgi:FkbM family methyltransferase